MKLYSIFDKKCAKYGYILTEENDFVMQRSVISTMKNQPRHDLVEFSDDFDLYCVGEFNTDTGEIKPYEHPKFITNCTALKETITNRG